MVGELKDPRRSEPAFDLAERAMLDGWLEFQRMTLLLKCEGLDDAQRKARPVESSLLSLHGLVRHMAEVERGWFAEVLLRNPDLPGIWFRPGMPDLEFFPIEQADWQVDLQIWHDQCDVSRAAAAAHGLDDMGDDNGKPCSLRWIYVHMIEEYARHNGHADLIREMVDGAVGW